MPCRLRGSLFEHHALSRALEQTKHARGMAQLRPPRILGHHLPSKRALQQRRGFPHTSADAEHPAERLTGVGIEVAIVTRHEVAEAERRPQCCGEIAGHKRGDRGRRQDARRFEWIVVLHERGRVEQQLGRSW